MVDPVDTPTKDIATITTNDANVTIIGRVVQVSYIKLFKQLSAQWIFITLDTKALRASRALIIFENNEWTLQIHGTDVPKTNEHVKCIPNLIDETYLEELFGCAQMDACIGNPVHDLQQICYDGKMFTNGQGEIKGWRR